MTGVTKDKVTYLAHVRKTPRRTEPRQRSARVDDDTAVVSGRQVNFMDRDGSVSQQEIQTLAVWVRREHGWKPVAFSGSGQRPA